MNKKVHGVFGAWMIFMLILALVYYLIDEMKLPIIIVVIWMICPFFTKLIGFDESINLIPNIIFSLICGFSLFGDSFILALGMAFVNLLMSTGYAEFAYGFVDDIQYKRRMKLVEKFRLQIRQRIDGYKKITDILSEIEKRPKADKFIELLAVCSTTSIKEAYIEKQKLQNIDLLKQVEKISNHYKLRVIIKNKTFLEIQSEIDKNVASLQSDEKRIEEYDIYELKHYKIL